MRERVIKGYWKKEENVIAELKSIVREYGSENLNYTFLRSNGYNNLLCAIQRLNKTIESYLPELSLDLTYTPKNYYKNLDNIKIEVFKLVNKYGYFPSSRELLTLEGKNNIPFALRKFHNKTLSEFLNELGIRKPKKSNLEIYIKSVLDKIIYDSDYIDNGRSNLLKFGLDTKNPKTNRYLEIDRYYYVQKIAIEIQGQQHYKPTKHWNSTRVDSVITLDIIKREILSNQNIRLIEVKYNNIGISTIYKQLQEAGVSKLCEKEKLFEIVKDNSLPS